MAGDRFESSSLPPRTRAGELGRLGETRELRILYQMAGALSRSLQLDDLLRDALHTLETLLHIPMSAVYLLEGTTETDRSFRLVAHRGFSPAYEVERLAYDTDEAWVRQTILEGRPYVCREPLTASGGLVSPRAKHEGIQSWGVVPLISRGRVLGVLHSASRELDKLDDEEVELLETLGPDLGVAIENAQLFELVQRGRNEWLSTFDSVEDQLAVLDPSLRLIRANAALLSTLHRPPAEVIGLSCREVFPDLCAGDCPHRQALAGRRAEHEVKRGQSILRLVAYRASSGGVIHVVRDISAEKKQEAQLIRTEKLSAASTVLAGVAHELNNPLTVVIAYADLLSQVEDASPHHSEIQQILRSALRCQSIVRNLLAFSRREAPQRAEVDLNQLVRDTLPLFAYQLRVSGVRVEERLNPTVPVLSGDRDRLQQILVNLVNNAYQAIVAEKRGGYLRVTTRMKGDRVELVVEDDGPGIPETVRPRVFEPFFSTKPLGEGTGLGLPLSLQSARDHGGDLVLETPPGGGTRVTVALPVLPATHKAPEIAPPPPGALADRRILVVDDEPEVRGLVESVLESYGGDVTAVGNGREALELIEQGQQFDLIFTDLRMPVMGGDELIAELRRSWPDLAEKTLLTTGDVAGPAAEEAIRRSGRPCVPKPFNVRTLVAALVELLPRRP